MEKLLAVTAIGPDRTGLIRDISRIVTDAGGGIHESRMIALGSEFAVLMLIAGNWHAVGKISEKLESLQKKGDLTITVPRQCAPRTQRVGALFGRCRHPRSRRHRAGDCPSFLPGGNSKSPR